MRSLALRSADAMRAALAAGILALSAGAAAAQGPSVFREVRLDMSGLPTGAVETRQQIASCLARSLPVAFAGRVNAGARSAPVLIVRPTSVWLSAPVTTTSEDFAGRADTSSPDFMEGEAIIGSRRVPISVAGAGESPTPVAPLQQAARRTEQLCQSFAYWLARRV